MIDWLIDCYFYYFQHCSGIVIGHELYVCLSVCVCQSYPMSRECRGKFLLICNDEFHSTSTNTDINCQQQQQCISDREGAEVDVHNIRTLFKRLQFDVVYHNNLTASVSIHCTRDLFDLSKPNRNRFQIQQFYHCIWSASLESVLWNRQKLLGKRMQKLCSCVVWLPWTKVWLKCTSMMYLFCNRYVTF